MGAGRLLAGILTGLIALDLALPVEARKNGSPAYNAPTSSRTHSSLARDSSGRIKRDPKARRSFQKDNPCPSTGKTSGACPGYVVDHVRPLKRGGADSPANMQWQTKQAAKEKDKWE